MPLGIEVIYVFSVIVVFASPFRSAFCALSTGMTLDCTLLSKTTAFDFSNVPTAPASLAMQYQPK
jgi:hypothetical protein